MFESSVIVVYKSLSSPQCEKIDKMVNLIFKKQSNLKSISRNDICVITRHQF